MASVLGCKKDEDIKQEYVSCLENLATSSKLPDSEIFENLPKEDIKPGRHADLLEKGIQTHGPNAFVDCTASLKRPVSHSGGIPCVTPSHPVYSALHARYLSPRDFLQAQGLFPSAYKPEVWERMCHPSIAQSIAGNSFSSTVCEAVLLASVASCPDLWAGIDSDEALLPPANLSIVQHHGTGDQPLRRVTGKRKADAYDFAKEKSLKLIHKPKPKPKSYKRKVQELDSRKFSKGKKEMVSIFAKMQMPHGFLFIGNPY